MSEEREMREVREMRGTAEGVLSARFGGRVRLDDGADLGGSARSFTYRYVVVDGPEGLPASVVAKKARAWEDEEYDPEAMDGPAAGMLLGHEHAYRIPRLINIGFKYKYLYLKKYTYIYI